MKIDRSFTMTIRERIWGPGDTYLVIPIGDMQVFKQDGWFGELLKCDLSRVAESSLTCLNGDPT